MLWHFFDDFISQEIYYVEYVCVLVPDKEGKQLKNVMWQHMREDNSNLTKDDEYSNLLLVNSFPQHSRPGLSGDMVFAVL